MNNNSGSWHSDTTFFARNLDQDIVNLLLYVDDMIINENDAQGIDQIKNLCKQEYEMTDLGYISSWNKSL